MLVSPASSARMDRASVINRTWMEVGVSTAVTANPTCRGGTYNHVLQLTLGFAARS